MRQKLINNNVNPTELKSAIPESDEKFISLSEVLFSKSITELDWKMALKHHSQKLTNLLLNDDIEGFNQYLQNSSSFGKQNNPDHIAKDSSSNQLARLNYKVLLKELLQLAILIEHSTIPPYLTALYSIKEGSNAWVSQVIRSIAVEEMLHMIMVCNVMNAIDIQPSVNRPENYPNYPSKLPLNVDFFINLEKCSKNSISTFITIESPSSPVVDVPFDNKHIDETVLFQLSETDKESELWNMARLESYIKKNLSTIGEFYDFVFFFIIVFQILEFFKNNGSWPTSFQDLNTGGIFTGDPKKQIHPDQYYGSGGILHTVNSLEGVVKVFEEIKGQGEGSDGTIFFTDPSQFEEGFEPAHYFRFKEILHEHTYASGDYAPFMDQNGMMPVTTPPTGKELKVEWDKVYPIKSNLKIDDLISHPKLSEQAKQFNKTYKKLLDVIQEAVEGNQEILAESIIIMYDLKEQAIALMKHPLNERENAAPTFEYPVN